MSRFDAAAEWMNTRQMGGGQVISDEEEEANNRSEAEGRARMAHKMIPHL